MMMMSHSGPSATPFDSVPSMPIPHSLPQGVPFGPWQSLYQASPGAQLPAVSLPQMLHGGLGQLGPTGVTLVGGLGMPAVTFVSGFGNADKKAKVFAAVLGGTFFSALIGGTYAWMIKKSKNPVRNAGLLTGGLTLTSGMLALILTNNNNAA